MHSHHLSVRPADRAYDGTIAAHVPAVMVIAPDRRLVHATSGGRALLDHGGTLHRCFDRIAATTQANARRLSRALTDVVAHGHAQILFEGLDERLDAEFIAVEPEDGQMPQIVVMVRSIRDDARERLHAAQAGFGLTHTETRLVAAVFEGCSVPQAAGRLGIARSTARTHLQRVFDKTGVRRQADLVRVIATA